MTRDELVTSTMDLARSMSAAVARRARSVGRADSAVDWFQEACLALCLAADEFLTLGRPDNEWRPYANTFIRHRLSNLCITPDGVSMSPSTAWRCKRGEGSKAAQGAFDRQPEPLSPANTAHLTQKPASDAGLRVYALLERASIADADRDAVVLHYLEGLAHAEVAEAMGWTVGQTRQRISRALARMREVEQA